MPNIAQALEPGGYLIVSGILKEQWEEVQQAFVDQGLTLLEKYDTKDQPWVTALVLNK